MVSTRQLAGIVLSMCTMILLSVPGHGQVKPRQSAEKKSSTVPRWKDPQKGKIWGKINFVQIPLTAYEDHIFGPVRSVSYKDYSVSETDGSKILDDSGYNVYDKFGHLVDQNEYTATGVSRLKAIYKYDPVKNVLLNIAYVGAAGTSHMIFEYNSKGKKIRHTVTDQDKKNLMVTIYKYDDKGNEVEITQQDGAGKITSIEAFKYDSRGFQVENTGTNAGGIQYTKQNREYDNYGNITAGSVTNNSIETKWVTMLDNKGRSTEEKQYTADGVLEAVRKYKYDDWDNNIEYMTYKADGSLDTAGWNTYTDFEYDSWGNAVKETWYKLISGRKTLTQIVERKFEYYR